MGRTGSENTEMTAGRAKPRNGEGTKRTDAATLREAASARAQASSSIGGAPVSKTGGWGFESLLACQPVDASRGENEVSWP
jgi:hypothetical protein